MNENQPYQQKEGTFSLWQKVSQSGEMYYSGKLLLNGKYYWINQFKNKYHTGMPEDKKPLCNGNVKPVE